MIERQERIPDLVVNRCPVSCEDCKTIYLNKQIQHRIICRCRCHSLTEETQTRLNTRNSLQGPRIETPATQAETTTRPPGDSTIPTYTQQPELMKTASDGDSRDGDLPEDVDVNGR